MSARKFWTF